MDNELNLRDAEIVELKLKIDQLEGSLRSSEHKNVQLKERIVTLVLQLRDVIEKAFKHEKIHERNLMKKDKEIDRLIAYRQEAAMSESNLDIITKKMYSRFMKIDSEALDKEASHSTSESRIINYAAQSVTESNIGNIFESSSSSTENQKKINLANDESQTIKTLPYPQVEGHSTDDDHDFYALISRFKSMLEMLAPKSFDVIVNEMKGLHIDTDRILDRVINMIFEKAVSEPELSPVIARFCKEIDNVFSVTTTILNPSHTDTDLTPSCKKSAFKVKLIFQCQMEFERHQEVSKDSNTIEGQANFDSKTKTRIEKLAKLKDFQRAKSTIRFIGEIYNIGILSGKVIRQCLINLLESPTDKIIERVCILLTTVGSKMEADFGPECLDEYILSLTDLLTPTSGSPLSKNIQRKIQNVVDLRQNNWRHIEAVPRTKTSRDNRIELFTSVFRNFIDGSRKQSFKETVKEMEKIQYSAVVVSKIYELSYDQTEEDRLFLVEFVCQLIESDYINGATNKIALIQAVENAPEFLCNKPNVYEYLAQFIAQFVVIGAITFDDIYSMARPDMRETILKLIITAMKVSQGVEETKKILDDSNTVLKKYLTDGNVKRFFDDIGFTYEKQNMQEDIPLIIVNRRKKKSTAN